MSRDRRVAYILCGNSHTIKYTNVTDCGLKFGAYKYYIVPICTRDNNIHMILFARNFARGQKTNGEKKKTIFFFILHCSTVQQHRRPMDADGDTAVAQRA